MPAGALLAAEQSSAQHAQGLVVSAVHTVVKVRRSRDITPNFGSLHLLLFWQLAFAACFSYRLKLSQNHYETLNRVRGDIAVCKQGKSKLELKDEDK